MSAEVEDVADGCVCGFVRGVRWVADTKGKLVFVSPVSDADRSRVAALVSEYLARRQNQPMDLPLENAFALLSQAMPVKGSVTLKRGDVGSGAHGYSESSDETKIIVIASSARGWWRPLETLAHEWAHIRVSDRKITEPEHGSQWQAERDAARVVLGLDAKRKTGGHRQSKKGRRS